MNTYAFDKLILILSSVAVAVYSLGSVYSVVFSLCISIVCYCVSYYFEKEKLTKLFYYLLIVVAIFNKPFCFFLGFMIYEMYQSSNNNRQQILFVLIPLILNIKSFEPSSVFLLILLYGMAFFLSVRNCKLIELEKQFNEFRDSNEEYKRGMETKNLELMEKQDYEVHMATMHERTRIAREIHDNVGHMLSRSILQVGALMAISKEPAQKEALNDLKETLTTAMTSIRESVHDLHDESIDLYDEINECVEHFTKCQIHFEYNITTDLNRKCKYSILAIIKEALSNIVKHSNATSVTLLLHEHPALYQILIQDNGTDLPDINESGIGLHNIEERVENMGGKINITTRHGFRIFISIPKEEKEKNK